MDWWDLPGPATFIEGIAKDLIDGRNVLLQLPGPMPAGLSGSVRKALDESLFWRTVSREEVENLTPLQWMSQTFCPTERTGHTVHKSIPSIIRHRAFVGHLFWIDDLPESRWSDWASFIASYEHACREIELLSRSLFCIALRGKLALHCPKEDVCLSIRRYDDFVSRLDMQLFVAHEAAGNGERGILEDLRLEVVSALAQWDDRLALELIAKPLRDLLNTVNCLINIATKWGWSGLLIESYDVSWALGLVHRLNGRAVLHSCMCAITDPDELRKRIWMAEVRVLYPFVEQQRQAILSRISARLRLPFKTRFGHLLRDARDLEIGHIEAILKSGSTTETDILRRVTSLRRIRNHIAHGDVVDLPLLQSQAIRDPL